MLWIFLQKLQHHHCLLARAKPFQIFFYQCVVYQLHVQKPVVVLLLYTVVECVCPCYLEKKCNAAGELYKEYILQQRKEERNCHWCHYFFHTAERFADMIFYRFDRYFHFLCDLAVTEIVESF